MGIKRKIINDPLYGLIAINGAALLNVIDHPWFQRLRRIRQMGLAEMIYPGATHTRFQHSIGAKYLMSVGLQNLRQKGFCISDTDYNAAIYAILLHDFGHGPFSHSLEGLLVENFSHEDITLCLIEALGKQLQIDFTDCNDILKGQTPHMFLKDLVSSQLDVDRMDYLNRDSFYSGVSEGVIGYDRILQMLTIHENRIAIEEKGIYSIEKFLIARHIMYWQVYLHKTVLGAEKLLIQIIRRVKHLAQNGQLKFCLPNVAHFLYNKIDGETFRQNHSLHHYFCELDDADILSCIKQWRCEKDQILSMLCDMMLDRKFFKTYLFDTPQEEWYEAERKKVITKFGFDEEMQSYFLLSGVASNKTYNPLASSIKIWSKEEVVKDLTAYQNVLVNNANVQTTSKYYYCLPKFEREY